MAQRGYQAPVAKASDKTKPAATKPAEPEEEVKKAEDTFTKGETTTDVTYKPPKKLTADALSDIRTQMANSYQQMLRDMVSKQGSMFNQISGMPFMQKTESASFGVSAVDPGGEYSVDAVANRLVDMAKALSGGDKSKIGLLRDAMEKGFRAAGVELGGLPSISQDTLAATRKLFDDWENE